MTTIGPASKVPSRPSDFFADKLPATSPLTRTLLCYLVVFIVAYCCFVVNRSDPPYLFWDENYHVTSSERYIEGIAQFETHPPLGKMLIAAGEILSGTNQGIDKRALTKAKKIDGDTLPKGFSFAGMRLMPSLFAAFGAVMFFGLMYELTQHRLQALLLSSLYLFENAYVVHFRAVHLDSFQMFFSIAALWEFVRLWKQARPLKWWHYATLAVLCALALMVKLNAIFLFVLFPMVYLKDAAAHDAKRPPVWVVDFAVKSGVAVLSSLLVIFATFYVHALLTPKLPDPNTSAGRQDIANMSAEYRTYLEQHQSLTPYIVVVIARDYVRFMDKDNKGVPKLDTKKPGENGSHPLHWPFHDRNINYRWDSSDGKTSYVELVGNQLSWYLGTTAVILSLVLIVNHRVFAVPLRGDAKTYQLIEVFAGLYVAFMLLHLWLITQRVMYLYHYFIGLLISYVMVALMWQYLCEIHHALANNRIKIMSSAACLILLSYLFFLPLTNHWPLTKVECERRNISVSHIVDCR